MTKIVYLSSSSSNPERLFQLRKHARVEQSDHINKLPDEVLCSIVSHMTLIDAAKTSVLARRWKTLWYHFHGVLEFDDTMRVLHSQSKTQSLHDFSSFNMQVLQSLQSPLFNAFKVRCYNADRFCEAYLDFCVQFAMKKGLKTFELDTFPTYRVWLQARKYKLPLEFCARVKKPCGLDDNISPLTSISLNGVTVNDDFIHNILEACPLLESLRVRDAVQLLNPKVIGGTLKLKYLEIWGSSVESIEVDAPNLFTFTTKCKKVKVLIKNASKLVELSIPVHILKNNPESVSSYLPRIEKLTWDFSKSNGQYDIFSMHQFVEQNKLQHLTWNLGSYNDRYSIQLNSLLEASPFLHKFTLVNYFNPPRYRYLMPTTVTAKRPHQCLKVLEIFGFTGTWAEVKLVKYFIANTTSLEKIILDIICPQRRGHAWMGALEHLKKSKLRALGLEQDLPPRVSLVILE